MSGGERVGRAQLDESFAGLSWLQAAVAELGRLEPWQVRLIEAIEERWIYGDRSGRPTGITTTGQLAFDQARARERAQETGATLLTAPRWRCLAGEWVPA